MKRYLLFSGCSYYPCGGVEDFEKSFSSPEAIVQHFRDLDKRDKKPDWANVLDIHTGTKYSINLYSFQFSKLQ